MSSSSDSGSDSEVEGPQVRVSLQLAASVVDRSLEVPIEPIAVPADIGRKGLSAVLNHLLGRSIPKDNDENDDSDSDDEDENDENKLSPVTFEFILSGAKNNRLLRKGVEKEARQYGLSLEEAIQITYFPACNVPQLLNNEETLPDWISCLSGVRVSDNDVESNNDDDKFLFSGCYDGSVHVYKQRIHSGDTDSPLTKVSYTAAASGPIKAMTTTKFDDLYWIASSSLDHSLNIHSYNVKQDGLQLYGQCIPMENDLSSATVFTSLDFSSTASTNQQRDQSKPPLLAGGDGNGKICVWDIQNGIVEEHLTTEKKKHKTSGSNKSRISKDVAPMVVMENAHTQLISGLSWGNHHRRHNSNNADSAKFLISGSWDHSIKLWDVEKQNCLLMLNGSRVISCLDTSYHSEGVVATGHPDCTIRLWDVRVNDNTKQSAIIADNTFRPSHKGWVSCVKWSSSNAYELASTSHDGTVKLWDIRSSIPLHTVRAFSKDEKGLCLFWDFNRSKKEKEHQIIYAGGTDRVLKQIKL